MFKLMIADDNPHTLQGLSEGTDWENFDFNLTGTFQNGKDLLEAAMQDMPDLVITDITMPQMDGFSLSKELYQLKPDIKIIFISNYSEFEYAKNALKLHIFDYILKPIQLNQLLDVMERVSEKLRQEQLTYFEKQQSKSQQDYYRKIALSHYVSRLLFQATDEQHIHTSLEQLGLPQTKDSYFLVVCFSLDESLDSCDEPQPANYFRSILECALGEAQIIPAILEHNHGAFLLQSFDRDLPVFDLLAQLGVDIEVKMNLRITMGYSDFSHHLTKLPTLYKQAQTALRSLLESKAIIPIVSYADINIPTDQEYSDDTEHSTSKTVAAMKAFIKEHYMEPITTNDVAGSVYLSPNYANRCFTAEYGITIFGYIVQYRLEKSKQLLRDTDEHITRIAEDVGYSSKTSFYLAFKRHTGISPTEYRQQYTQL